MISFNPVSDGSLSSIFFNLFLPNSNAFSLNDQFIIQMCCNFFIKLMFNGNDVVMMDLCFSFFNFLYKPWAVGAKKSTGI